MYALSYRYRISFEVRKTLRIHEQNSQDKFSKFQNFRVSEFRIITKDGDKVVLYKNNVRPGGETPVATYVLGELISGRSIEPSQQMYALLDVQREAQRICTHSKM